jgi:hypothetical protein
MGIDRRPVDQFHTANAGNYAENRSKSKVITRSTAWFTDPETKRRKRVAQYKFVSMEGKAKQTVRNSFRWLKGKYIALRYGVW